MQLATPAPLVPNCLGAVIREPTNPPRQVLSEVDLAVRWGMSLRNRRTQSAFSLPENPTQLEAEHERNHCPVARGIRTKLKFIVPMLILTGARKREVLDAKWTDFDLERRIWRIPTTKAGKARHVPLSDGVISRLSTMPRNFNWAFANPDTGKPYVSIYYAWHTARTKAGLADVRMHDLRHSFASLLINSGRTLYEVQNILGHTQVKTTQRYAHLSQDTLLAAANTATAAINLPIGLPQLENRPHA